MAFGVGKGMLLSIFSIIFAIGLILTILPPGDIAAYVGNHFVFVSTVVAAFFGTITLVPAFIAFSLVGSLVSAGVTSVPSVAFPTTLTMVDVVTFPLEKKAFGHKFTALRNLLNFGFAIGIAFIMRVFYENLRKSRK